MRCATVLPLVLVLGLAPDIAGQDASLGGFVRRPLGEGASILVPDGWQFAESIVGVRLVSRRGVADTLTPGQPAGRPGDITIRIDTIADATLAGMAIDSSDPLQIARELRARLGAAPFAAEADRVFTLRDMGRDIAVVVAETPPRASAYVVARASDSAVVLGVAAGRAGDLVRAHATLATIVASVDDTPALGRAEEDET